MRKLRIAQVAPLSIRVPPVRYGGTERIVFELTEELVQRGHDVTLFAAGTSLTSALLWAGSPKPLWELEPHDRIAYEVAQVEDVVRRSRRFDIIHWHIDYLHWFAVRRTATPSVTTLHGRLDGASVRRLFVASPYQPVISISEAQRRPLAAIDANWVATVHHGLNLAESYELGTGEGGYLVFLGRSSPEKDLATAIRVAIRARIPLKIAARIGTAHTSYHESEVADLLNHPLVEWLGEVDQTEKARLLAGAAALLMPVNWEEPFGLAFIESLAAGVPVITRPRGALPEIMRHGEHGFFAESEDDLVEACKSIGSIDRSRCRDWAITNFSTGRMAGNYEAAYASVLEGAMAGTSNTIDLTSASALSSGSIGG